MTDSPSSCPRCSRSRRPHARFCDHCGLALSPEDTDTEILDGSLQPNTSSRDPLAGLIINSKYQILEQIAAGGMGKVYRARRLQIGDEVVVKLLDKKYLSDPIAAQRFRLEAQAAARIRHQNVVVIHDFGEGDSDEVPAYIVMELVAGVSLRDILQAEGRLSVERTIALMRAICRGVGAGHIKGIIHRDIKPGNIIVLKDEENMETAKVVDFGLAKIRDETSDQFITQAGMILGTPSYMSPEQCRGEPLTTRTDVYSLGILTYEMLAGFVPFTGSTSASTCLKHQNQVPPPLPANLGITRSLEAVLMRGLAKNPDDRQSDATGYSRELQDAFEGRPVARFAEMQSTVEDGLPRASGVANGSSDLNRTELAILAWSFEKAMQRRHNSQIEVEYVLDRARLEGFEREDVLHSLERLGLMRLIEIARSKRENKDFNHYSVTAAAFDYYAAAFVADYESIKQEVIRCITRGSATDNFAVANSVKHPQALIDQIFNSLSENRLITISRRLGGKLIVKTLSPGLPPS